MSTIKIVPVVISHLVNVRARSHKPLDIVSVKETLERLQAYARKSTRYRLETSKDEARNSLRQIRLQERGPNIDLVRIAPTATKLVEDTIVEIDLDAELYPDFPLTENSLRQILESHKIFDVQRRIVKVCIFYINEKFMRPLSALKRELEFQLAEQGAALQIVKGEGGNLEAIRQRLARGRFGKFEGDDFDAMLDEWNKDSQS